MNFNKIHDLCSYVAYKAVAKTDDVVGKKLVKAGNILVGQPKIPSELSTQLYEVGVDVSGKNTRRLVEASLKNQMLLKLDSAVKMGTEISTMSPEVGCDDMAVATVEAARILGLRNTSFACASDNARNILSFCHEDLSQEAKNVISSYLKSPKNVLKLYR